MGGISNVVLAVVGGVLGLAVVAVVLSSKAQTPTVLTSAGNALGYVIGLAVSPVSGNTQFGSSSQPAVQGIPA